jgi:GGDEF domain-containing protein
LGHAFGEALLRKVAERLRSCLADGDMLARLSGNEFAVLPFGVGPQADPSALADRLIDAIGEGVATQEELDCLRRVGRTEAQGCFFSRPVAASDVAKMFAPDVVVQSDLLDSGPLEFARGSGDAMADEVASEPSLRSPT